MVQESTWRKEAIAAKVGKRSYFHCQPITACVDVRRASLKISLKSDPVHLKLHPPVSLIAPVELYMKPKIFPAPGGELGYNSTGAITGVKRYTQLPGNLYNMENDVIHNFPKMCITSKTMLYTIARKSV